MDEFRTPGYDGPEGTEWPRPRFTPEQKDALREAIPADYVGPALVVIACGTHGAHINFDYYTAPGVVLELAQINPEQANAFATQLLDSVTIAQEAIDAWKADQN